MEYCNGSAQMPTSIESVDVTDWMLLSVVTQRREDPSRQLL